MRLKRLDIHRLPGIDQPFTIQPSGAGVHVIFGPNAIGKSSICRAVEWLYWMDRGPSERTAIAGEFEVAGKTWRAEREGSRVRWQCRGERLEPPPIPPSHNRHCFFLRLRDLIDPSLEGTQDIASDIRRQMFGGFDLERVKESLSRGVRSQHGRREQREYRAAERAVQEAEGRQSALQRRADRLDALGAELEALETNARRVPSIDRALGLADRVEELAVLKRELAALPNAFESLSGAEDKEIAELQERIDEYDNRVRDTDAELEAARNDLRNSRLTDALSEADIAIWRQRADELGRIELKLQAAANDFTASEMELAAALSAIGGADVAAAALDLDSHARLFASLRAAEDHRTKKSAIEWRLRLLESIAKVDDDDRLLEELRGAAVALRSWLRAPAPETSADRIRARRMWILLAVGLSVAGAGLAVLADPRFGFLLAAALGVMVPVLLIRSPQASAEARRRAEKEFESAGIEAPDSWDVPSVESRLRGLGREIAAVDARRQRARDRDVDRQTLISDLEGLATEEATLNEWRETLRKSLNLEALLPDAELVDAARALDQLRSAQRSFEGAKGRHEELEAVCTRLCSSIAGFLEECGEKRPEDAASAREYLGSLADRNARLIDGGSRERRAAKQREEALADRGSARDAIQRIFALASLGDGDMPALRALLDQLPGFRDLNGRAASLESQIQLDRDELARAGESELTGIDRSSLERLKRSLSTGAAEAAELRDEIAKINALVNTAKRENSLQEQMVLRERARAELQDRRDEALFARAGAFLVDDIETEYEQSQMPRVFQRARGHFNAFARHGYELRLGSDARKPRLTAVDLACGEERELDELSDGTRAQLLLAARLAFAEEVEQGIALPLFLDEALDHSDPDRFKAIVGSLGDIAESRERQIFVLTSDPADIGRVEAALAGENRGIGDRIDLGKIRTGIASADPKNLTVPKGQPVPAPGPMSSEEYGAALCVPRFAPTRGSSGQHFFYLLWDNLELLHRFLGHGIEWAGQWKVVFGTDLASRLCSGSVTSEEVSQRVDLLEVFCALWSVGRGRPVDRDAILGSGAVSVRYLDSVVTIANDLGGDAAQLLLALRSKEDSRLKGFRGSAADELEKHLRDAGFLDDRPGHSGRELQLRALASPAANDLPDGVASESVRRWGSWAERMSPDG